MASLEITVECDRCGEQLGVTSPYIGNLYVVPCDKCLDEEHDLAYAKGYDEGCEDGEGVLA